MKLSPCLNFNGQCEAAFKFYEQCLGGRIQTMMTWGDSPMADQVPSEWRDKIIHASMIVGETSLLASDAPPDRYEAPTGMSVTIHIKGVADAERITPWRKTGQFKCRLRKRSGPQVSACASIDSAYRG